MGEALDRWEQPSAVCGKKGPEVDYRRTRGHVAGQLVRALKSVRWELSTHGPGVCRRRARECTRVGRLCSARSHAPQSTTSGAAPKFQVNQVTQPLDISQAWSLATPVLA